MQLFQLIAMLPCVVRTMRAAKSEVFQIDPEAKELHESAALVAEGRAPLLMESPDGTLAPLPEELGRAFMVLAAGLASGNAMVVAESGSTVSPIAAAEMLGVSRPMVTRWIAEGLLADVPVGAHHRVPIASVVALREARTQAGYRAMKASGDSESAARVGAARERARKRIRSRTQG